jgi:hypothetical protein
VQGEPEYQRLRDGIQRVSNTHRQAAARPLRCGRLLNAVAAALPVSRPEACEKRVARAEQTRTDYE